MGSLPDQCCKHCRQRALPGTNYCAVHLPKVVENAAAKEYDKSRARTPDRKFYNTAAWAETTKLVKLYNPMCQHVDTTTGIQCQRKPDVTHHLLDPRDAPNLKLAWQNLVAVCSGHHAGGERGETQGERYVHTIGPLQAVYKHIPDGGYPQWHKLFKRAAPTEASVPGLPLPCGGRASVLGDDALDAALAAND